MRPVVKGVLDMDTKDFLKQLVAEEQTVLDTAYTTVSGTAKQIRAEIENCRGQLDELRGDSERLEDYRYQRRKIEELGRQAKDIEKWLESLYFGRIDFWHNGDPTSSMYYIGKLGGLHLSRALASCEKAGINVVDWRAPIAEVYYSRNDSYMNPNTGEQEHGELLLVRQLEVKRDRVLDVTDHLNKSKRREEAAAAAVLKQQSDRILPKFFSRSGRERFVDVVSTIQADQNRLIRYPLDKHLIVQGAAGTGKTVVLLHRAAYAAYVSKCKPEEILILAPHRLLLEQIAATLPDLNVYDVPQLTLEEFFWSVVGRPAGKALNFSFCPFVAWDMAPAKLRAAQKWALLRCGKKALEVLDAIVGETARYAVEQFEDLVHDGQRFVRVEGIREFLKQEFLDGKPYGEQHIRLRRWLERQVRKRLIQDQNLTSHGEYDRIDWDARAIVSRYLARFPSIDELYWDRIVWAYRSYAAATHVLRPGIDWGEAWTVDDAGALLYLYVKFVGTGGRKYKFIFVDEAQGLNPAWLAALKEFLAPGGSLSLAGDVFQLSTSVYGNLLSGRSWDWVGELLGGNVAVESLAVSYRSTADIVDMAKWALERVLPRSAFVLRSVRPAEDSVFQAKTLSEFLEFVAAAQDVETAAVICPSRERAAAVAEKIGPDSCGKSLYVLSVEQVSGLEFDAVLVDSIEVYDRSNPAHACALYTAISRAVHYLFLSSYTPDCTGQE